MAFPTENLTEYAQELKDFLQKWRPFVDDVHPFDLYAIYNNIHSEQIDSSKATELMGIYDEWIHAVPLEEFLELMVSIHEQKSIPTPLQELIEDSERLRLARFNAPKPSTTPKQMSLKKYHEIHLLAKILEDITSPSDTIIDFGSGLGYLADLLSTRNKVIAIECDEYKSHKSKDRCGDGVVHVCAKLHPENAKELMSQFGNGDFVLTGLHACGDLSAKVMLDLFQLEKVKGMVSVGCCYHWISLDHFPQSQFLKKIDFRISRRLLKVSQNDFGGFKRKEMYKLWKQQTVRAIIHQKGRISVKEGDLMTQVKQYTQKYQLDLKLSPEELDLLLKRVSLLSTIRSLVGPVVEAFVLLDRYMYLSESYSNVQLVPVFDSTISPRNHALVCQK